MKSEEDKDKETKDEESESESEEEKENIKKLENKILSIIKIDEDGKLLGVNFNKENCVKSGLLRKEDTELYSNLYPIEFTKDIQVCEYPFIIKPECHEESIILKILREASPELFKTYGYYYRSGNSFYALKLIEKHKFFKVVIHHKGWIQYTIFVQDTPKVTVIEKDSIMKKNKEKGKISSENEIKDFDEFTEKMIYLVIREILSANPYVHFDRDNLYLENKKKEIKGYNNTYFLHDGYKISLQKADIGLCLVIGVKNKIKGKFSLLDIINNNTNEENENLEGRRFIPFEGSRSQIIWYIDYDKNPMNTIRNYRQETFKYYDYYDKIWNIKIKDKNQPLIVVNVKDPQYKEKQKCYVPELCYLVGINDEDTRDFKFMQEVIENTRLSPKEKVEQIEKCIDLFVETAEKKSINNDQKGENLNTIFDDVNNTSKKKLDYYGIQISKLGKRPIKPYYLTQPKFNNAENEGLDISEVNRVFPVGREIPMNSNWICLYTIQAEKLSFNLLRGFLKCCKGYNLKFKNNDSNWIPMKSQNITDWINVVEKELKKRKNCKFVIFLINNKTDKLYIPLKKHSLCTQGYISQVIKYESIMRAMKNKRGPDSYFSKILLQINNKLGGFNYFLDTDEVTNERNIILIGVDTSHTWGKKTKKYNNKKIGLAMVATKDKNFSKFYSKNEIIKYDKHFYSDIRRNISQFIKEAVEKYIKEKKSQPKNIIIYRQGIAPNQSEKIKLEVLYIEEICQKLKVNYYYVLVNTRTNIKFFEYNKENNYKSQLYKNPEQGLIILDQVTNKSRFEFYLQPQKVNIGSATPTYFHVAYGNMGFPELLIKLTYWTTFIYPNWQNSIRVPHVLKMAEKLAIMTASFTKSTLNEELSDTQAFL